MWTEILIGLSLMFVVEGVVLALGPEMTRKAMREIAQLPNSVIRYSGIASMLLGLMLLLAIK